MTNDCMATVWDDAAWTLEDESIVRSMVSEGKTNAEIAAALNRNINQVSGKVTRLGLNGSRRPKRKKRSAPFMPSCYSRLVLIREARKRNISVQELEARLLDIVAREKLVDAILDDGAEAAE